jgi:glutamate synthase (NADPH/NADH) small chain
MAIPAQAMPSQDPAVPRGNMSEVALGLLGRAGAVEAQRCLQCKNAPCVQGCPVRIRIPDFLKAAAGRAVRRGGRDHPREQPAAAVCGRVCPQEVQCQAPCTLGKALKDVDKAVSIGRVERMSRIWSARAAGRPRPRSSPPPAGGSR